MKTPLLFVTVRMSTLVSWLMACTVASGTTPPDVSVTVPVIEAVVDNCALAVTAPSKAELAAQRILNQYLPAQRLFREKACSFLLIAFRPPNHACRRRAGRFLALPPWPGQGHTGPKNLAVKIPDQHLPGRSLRCRT